MNRPGAVIAEDEPLIRREIREMLAQLWPELTILAEVGDGVEALAAVERYHPHVSSSTSRCPVSAAWKWPRA